MSPVGELRPERAPCPLRKSPESFGPVGELRPEKAPCPPVGELRSERLLFSRFLILVGYFLENPNCRLCFQLFSDKTERLCLLGK
jgi:hypothetical protein